MMPRLYTWAHYKRRGPQTSASHGYIHHSDPRSPVQSHGSSASGLLTKGGKKAVTRPDSTYVQIEEHTARTATWWENYNGPGIQKTVSIELTRQDAISPEQCTQDTVRLAS